MPFSLGTIILAAGRAVRMGRPKLLLPWGNNSILSHLIQLWREVGARQVTVVCAAGDAKMRAELDRLSFNREDIVENPDPQRGMFSSIMCAARWSGWQPSLTHWAIVLGDQPHLQPSTLRNLLNCARQNPGHICQPTLKGRPKHPVVLPKSVMTDLAACEATDLKEFLAGHCLAGCECADLGLALDIDRPEDYERALAVAGLSRTTTQ